MKGIRAVLAVILMAANVYAVQILPKIGLDMPGKLDVSTSNGLSSSDDVNSGISISVEGLFPQESVEGLSIGAGFEYQMDRDISAENGVSISPLTPSFYYVPIYATGIYSFTNVNGSIIPFGKLNLGYNVVFGGNDQFTGSNTTLKGGLYWAIGGGVRINKNINAELLYSSYQGTADSNYGYGSFSADLSYSKIELSLGYLFDLESNQNSMSTKNDDGRSQDVRTLNKFSPNKANAKDLELRVVPGWGVQYYDNFPQGGPSLYMQCFWKFSKKFKLGLETGYVSLYDNEYTYYIIDNTGNGYTSAGEYKDSAFAIPFNIVGKFEFLSDTRVTPFIELALGCSNVNYKTSYPGNSFSSSKTFPDGGFGVGLKIKIGKVGIEPYFRVNTIATGDNMDFVDLATKNIGVGISF
jgi:hypothetical protein